MVKVLSHPAPPAAHSLSYPKPALQVTGALYPTTEDNTMTNTDQANIDFFADITGQLAKLDEQRALRQTAINCLEIGATALAEAALETAIDLVIYPNDGNGTTNEQALRLINQGEIETAMALLEAAVERPRVAH